AARSQASQPRAAASTGRYRPLRRRVCSTGRRGREVGGWIERHMVEAVLVIPTGYVWLRMVRTVAVCSACPPLHFLRTARRRWFPPPGRPAPSQSLALVRPSSSIGG